MYGCVIHCHDYPCGGPDSGNGVADDTPFHRRKICEIALGDDARFSAIEQPVYFDRALVVIFLEPDIRGNDYPGFGSRIPVFCRIGSVRADAAIGPKAKESISASGKTIIICLRPLI